MIDLRLPTAAHARFQHPDIDLGNSYVGPGLQGGLVAYPESVAQRLGVEVLSPVGLGTTQSALEPLREEPSHRSQMISEVRGGEWLTLLRHEGEWWLVAGEDDYVGWMADWTVVRQEAGEREADLSRYLGRVVQPRLTLWNSDHWAAAALALATPLLRVADATLHERGGQHLVEVAGGAQGWLPGEAFTSHAADGSVEAALRVATQLLGTPYRWGGRSPSGIDCSGLVQLACLMAGFALPRDAKQQARVGEHVSQNQAQWRAGDLLFFDDPVTHVGLFDGRGALLHARGWVRRDQLDDIGELMARLTGVRRLDDSLHVTRATLWSRPILESVS